MQLHARVRFNDSRKLFGSHLLSRWRHEYLSSSTDPRSMLYFEIWVGSWASEYDEQLLGFLACSARPTPTIIYGIWNLLHSWAPRLVNNSTQKPKAKMNINEINSFSKSFHWAFPSRSSEFKRLLEWHIVFFELYFSSSLVDLSGVHAVSRYYALRKHAVNRNIDSMLAYG